MYHIIMLKRSGLIWLETWTWKLQFFQVKFTFDLIWTWTRNTISGRVTSGSGQIRFKSTWNFRCKTLVWPEPEVARPNFGLIWIQVKPETLYAGWPEPDPSLDHLELMRKPKLHLKCKSFTKGNPRNKAIWLCLMKELFKL